MPDVRHELLTTLKAELVPLGVLDEFKSAGVFVNWWQQIRYDLKTIVSIGWHHSLIPDDYLVAEFFRGPSPDRLHRVEGLVARRRRLFAVFTLRLALEADRTSSGSPATLTTTSMEYAVLGDPAVPARTGR